MNYEFGEAITVCAFHPSQRIVGICALCLTERLRSLKLKHQKRSQKATHKHTRSSSASSSSATPSSSSSSSKSTIFKLIHASDSNSSRNHHASHSNYSKKGTEYRSCGVKAHGETLAVTVRRHRQPTKGLFWFNRVGFHGRKLEKVKAFSIRALFQRLTKRKAVQKPKPQTECISNEDSFISIKLDGGSWASSVLPTEPVPAIPISSERSSTSDARTSWDGILFDRDLKPTKDPQLFMESALSPFPQKPSATRNSASNNKKEVVRWKTRMNGLFQLKRRMAEEEEGHCQQPTQRMKLRLRKSINKIWTLSSSSLWKKGTKNPTIPEWAQKNGSLPKWNLY